VVVAGEGEHFLSRGQSTENYSTLCGYDTVFNFLRFRKMSTCSSLRRYLIKGNSKREYKAAV
jgi:hypothetical protein